MKRPQAILLAVLLLIVAGYGIFTYYSVWSQRASDSTAPTHMFDAITARAGDVIVGMEIAINDIQLLAPFGPSGIVQFSGRATVSGVYRVVVDADPRTWVVSRRRRVNWQAPQNERRYRPRRLVRI